MNIPRNLVQTLGVNGMALFPVSQTLVEEARGAYLQLIKLFQEDSESFSFTRPGEDEPDVGLVYRPGKNGSDHKYFFHHTSDLSSLVDESGQMTPLVLRHLRTLERLRELLGLTSVRIGQQLIDDYPAVFNKTLYAKILEGLFDSLPYSTTTLRGLLYPNTTAQNGAKAHIDRSLMTVHLGDEGGSLIALQNKDDTMGIPVSPPKGQALIFFGVKMLYVSSGFFKPLWHSSTVDESVDRTAMVQFVHTDIGFPVTDASDAYDAFYARR